MIYGVRHVEMGVKQLRGEGGGEGGGGGGEDTPVTHMLQIAVICTFTYIIEFVRTEENVLVVVLFRPK